MLFALGIAEVLVRLSNYRPGTMDPLMYVANPNPLLPYRLQANYRGYCAGGEVHTDNDGNRRVSPTYPSRFPARQEKSVREVLILGDSGVFGFGLPDGDTVASQLQGVCAQRNLLYDIRNVGVPGYTSWNEYAALEDYLKEHEVSDVVLLYMPNDLTFDNDYFGIGRGGYASYSGNEDRAHRLLRDFYTHVYLASLLSQGLKRAAGMLRTQAPAEEKFDQLRMQPEIDYSMAALVKIRDLCRDKRIRLSVGIYRDVAFYYDSQSWLAYEQTIQSNLAKLGIELFLA